MEKFDEFAANHQSWPTWKNWAMVIALCVLVFVGPMAFYHNGVMSNSWYGLSYAVRLSDEPLIFSALVTIWAIVMIFTLIVWVIALLSMSPMCQTHSWLTFLEFSRLSIARSSRAASTASILYGVAQQSYGA